MMFKYEITITGSVQGIGYRYFVMAEARRLKLTGWVKNLYNGDVEILLESEKNILENFVSILKTKHRWAKIDNVKISETETSKKEFSDFNIIF
ncbi:MAG: acylphosphatase [Elusimicrobiota bacterium]